MKRVAYVCCVSVLALFFVCSAQAVGSQSIVGNYSGTAEITSPYGFSSTSAQISVSSQSGKLFQGIGSFMGNGNTFNIYGMLLGRKIMASSTHATIDGFMDESFTTFSFTIRCSDPAIPYVATGTMTKY